MEGFSFARVVALESDNRYHFVCLRFGRVTLLRQTHPPPSVTQRRFLSASSENGLWCSDGRSVIDYSLNYLEDLLVDRFVGWMLSSVLDFFFYFCLTPRANLATPFVFCMILQIV